MHTIDLPSYETLISPLNLAEHASGGAYAKAPHLVYLEHELMSVLYGPWDVLVAQAPPRHGKSQFLSRWFPTWFHSVYPQATSILTSYSMELARAHSRWVRDQVHMLAPWYGHEGVNPLVSAAGDWQMQGYPDSGMKAAGVGGGITGRGAMIAVIDDALKNADQALSARIRESQWEWFQTTLLTRLEPGAKLFLLATRWHDEDLLGMVLSKGQEDLGLRVRECRLPALSEGDGDPLGRPVDAPLWPDRWSYEEMCRRRQSMEEYWWLALYQQLLTTHGKNEWPASYSAGLLVPDEEWPQQFHLSSSALDPSLGKDSKKGDYSAMCHAGWHRGCVWLDLDAARRPVPVMIDDFVRFNYERRPALSGIESVAFQHVLGESYVQAIGEQGITTLDDPVLIEQKVSKAIRIRRLGFWLRLHVVKVRDNPGGRMLVKQIREFPNGDHDDCLDAAEMAIRLLLELSTELTGLQQGDYQGQHLEA